MASSSSSSSSLLAGLDQPASEDVADTPIATSSQSPTRPDVASSAAATAPTDIPHSLSLDTIPSASQALQDLSVATPPIHQQELILSSLSHTAAADDEDGTLDGRHATQQASPSTTAPIQDKGTGWALLSHSRSSSTSSPRQPLAPLATAPPPTSSSATRGRSTTSRPLHAAATTSPPPQTHASTSRASSMVLDHVSSSSAPGTPTNAASSPATIDCDTPSRKAKNVDDASPYNGHSHSHSRPVTRRLTNSMELPAEGAGLRGKDENKMVIDQDEERGRVVDGADAAAASTSNNPLDPPPARKLCIRHQRMADEGTVGKLQRVSRARRSSPLPPVPAPAGRCVSTLDS